MVARILIAEDHPDSLELMQYLLRAHGYSTATACDGERALALAREEPFDLILCDLQMAKMSGYEVAAQLKAENSPCRAPLIAVTAFSMLGDSEKVLAAGFDAYFSKPIEPERFVTQIETYLPEALRAPAPNQRAGD